VLAGIDLFEAEHPQTRRHKCNPVFSRAERPNPHFLLIRKEFDSGYAASVAQPTTTSFAMGITSRREICKSKVRSPCGHLTAMRPSVGALCTEHWRMIRVTDSSPHSDPRRVRWPCWLSAAAIPPSAVLIAPVESVPAPPARGFVSTCVPSHEMR
jgi:hypothetical protein